MGLYYNHIFFTTLSVCLALLLGLIIKVSSGEWGVPVLREGNGEGAVESEAVRGGGVRGDKRQEHEALHEVDLLSPR